MSLLSAYILIIYSCKKKLRLKLKPKKQIFTFWEPKEKIPGYLKLCIRTWKKFLPEYNINIMNFKSTKDYIGEYMLSRIVSKNLPLPIQADAIRVALLNQSGGIWMDPDTIITNSDFLKTLENYELVMIGEKKMQHIGFIIASNNSDIINNWLKEILKKVKIYNQFNNKNINIGIKWSFLGNMIIDKLLQNSTDKKFFRLDMNKIFAFPEVKFFENSKLNMKQRYIKLYFSNREPKIILEKVKGLIMLHNSWTPIKYKKLTETKFLKENILLSKLLSKILK